MPDATKRPLSEWCEKEWLHHLQRQAQRLTACPHHADDLAHTCLIAFYDHRRYPWQHPEPAHALRWCCQKLRALACDAHRYAERHPCLALETLPESVACVDIAAQVQGDIDGERFLASLPPRLRAVLELRLAGYSWDKAAQQLGVKASTLRGYLPELRAKFVDFFGYDPSKRASESLLGQRGKQPPQRIEEETQMKAILGLVNGLVTTRNMLRAKSLVAMGRAKRGGLRGIRRVLMGSKGRWLIAATLFGVLNCLLLDVHGQVVISDPQRRDLEVVRNRLSAEFEKVVVLRPKDLLVMRPLGDYTSHREILESNGTVRVTNWDALGGDVVAIGEEYVIYTAPEAPGIYPVIWSNGTETLFFLVEVVEKDTELPECTLEPIVPTAGDTPFLLLFSPYEPLATSEGVKVCIKKGVPLNPGSRPRGRCTGGSKTVSNTKTYQADRWREIAEITITSQLSAELARIGINVSVGTTIKVEAHERVHTTIDNEDCYRCENGVWKLVGGRVSYTRCVYVIEYRPTWVCDAVAAGIIRLDPCGGRPIPDYNCVYWGDCKCPDTVITGCP
jgi:DNA-directed RNA polymerase specialized sigma24 family protein